MRPSDSESRAAAPAVGTTSAAAPLALRVRGLRKRFGSAPPDSPDVLGGIDLDVRPGEFLAVVGASGCGKSTLLSILADIEEATAGTVDVDRDHLAFVFQRPLLLPWRNVIDNVTFSLECHGRRKRDVRDDARRLLERMGLGDVLTFKPHELSVGMRQRVDLARALLVRPKLLLMDEPFSALDRETQLAMHDELLQRWQEAGFTVVLVSHDLEEVVALSDRVVFLSDKPARVEEIVEVGLPRPRGKGVEGKIALLKRVEELLARPGRAPRSAAAATST